MRQLTDTTVNFFKATTTTAPWRTCCFPTTRLNHSRRARACVCEAAEKHKRNQATCRSTKRSSTPRQQRPPSVPTGEFTSLIPHFLFTAGCVKPAHAMFDEEDEATREQPITYDEGRGLQCSVNSPARPDPGIKGLKFNFKPSSGCRAQIPVDGCRLHYGSSSTASPLHA